jgi:SNF2 family DNA or RNA helicase
MMDRLLEKLKAAGHRVVIFSQYTHMLDIIGTLMPLTRSHETIHVSRLMRVSILCR